MTAPLPPSLPSPSDIVSALRAAGCVFAEEEARLITAAAAGPDSLAGLVARRAAGEPLEHVLGWAEFDGLRMAVQPGVFVPRRRTEFLVDRAAALAPRGVTPVVVVDLCCGSGALGAALAARLGAIDLHAADVDPAAVACARRNVAAAGGRVYAGDLFEPLPPGLRGRVQLLLANVPYVPSGEVALLPAEARLHEPRWALDGGADGLDLLRRVAAAAPDWLVPGGHLLSETSERQAGLAAGILAGHGLTAEVISDPDRNATVIVGTRPVS
jgi:release factor glutamine methyltransferase